MAKGRAFGRFEALLGVVGLVALAVAASMVTGWKPPVSKLVDRLDRPRTLAEPAPAWTVKVGDQASAAVLASGTVIVTAGSTLSGYGVAGGSQRWTRTAPWSAVAGSGTAAVVLAGHVGGRGYDALDPDTGSVRWSDPAGTGAWTFTDLVIGLGCAGPSSCTLTARWPGSGVVRWEVALSGDAHALGGANHPLVGIRQLARRPATPGAAPALLGLPIDDNVVAVDVATGARLRQYHSTPQSWAAVAGDRVVVTTGNYRGGTCHPHAEGRDPATDRPVWQRDVDLHTGTSMGCDQRTDPTGAAGLLEATGPDGREVLLDPATGTDVFRAGTGEKILDTDGATVLVRAADHGVTAVDLRTGAARWHRVVGRSAGVVLGPGVTVVTDAGTGRLVALSATGQVLADVKSDASVLGYAPTGLIVGVGREVGLITYAGSAGR